MKGEAVLTAGQQHLRPLITPATLYTRTTPSLAIKAPAPPSCDRKRTEEKPVISSSLLCSLSGKCQEVDCQEVGRGTAILKDNHFPSFHLSCCPYLEFPQCA